MELRQSGTREKIILLLCCTLFFLLILDRVLLLFHLSSTWIDDDQAIMWVAVQEILKGRIHQLHFYGQAYNIMIEPFLAAPMLLLQMPHCYALPLSSLLLAIFPFLLFGVYFWKQGQRLGVMLALAYLLSLALPYSFLSSMPRGFMGGIAVAAAAVIVLLKKDSRPRMLLLSGLLTVLAYSINPNAVLLLLPVIAMAAPQLLSSRERLRPFMLGMFIAAVFHLLIQAFYIINPHLNRHKLGSLDYKIELLQEGLKNAADFFGIYSPFGFFPSYACVVFFAVCFVLLLFRRKFKIAIFFLTAFAIVLLSLGTQKVHNASHSIFFSYARSYLGLPLLVAFGLMLLPFPQGKRKLELIVGLCCIIISLFGVFWRYAAIDTYDKELRSQKPRRVWSAKVALISSNCAAIREHAIAQAVEMVIFVKGGNSRILSYVCPVIYPDFPSTRFVYFERRRWLLKREKNLLRKRFLIYNVTGNFLERAKGQACEVLELEREPRVYLLIHKGISTGNLIRAVLPREKKQTQEQ